METWSSNFFLKQIPHKVDVSPSLVCFHILDGFQTSWVGLSGNRTGRSVYKAPTNLFIWCQNPVWLQSCWAARALRARKLHCPQTREERAPLEPRQKQPFQWIHLLTGPSLCLQTIPDGPRIYPKRRIMTKNGVTCHMLILNKTVSGEHQGQQHLLPGLRRIQWHWLRSRHHYFSDHTSSLDCY